MISRILRILGFKAGDKAFLLGRSSLVGGRGGTHGSHVISKASAPREGSISLAIPVLASHLREVFTWTYLEPSAGIDPPDITGFTTQNHHVHLGKPRKDPKMTWNTHHLCDNKPVNNKAYKPSLLGGYNSYEKHCSTNQSFVNTSENKDVWNHQPSHKPSLHMAVGKYPGSPGCSTPINDQKGSTVGMWADLNTAHGFGMIGADP